MSTRGKTRARRSTFLVRQSTAHGLGSSNHGDSETQGIAMLMR